MNEGEETEVKVQVIPYVYAIGEGDDKVVATKVINGVRLPHEEGIPQEVYAVMQHCWAVLPKDRPLFAELQDTLLNLYTKEVSKAQVCNRTDSE